jgi:hypothetical protein
VPKHLEEANEIRLAGPVSANEDIDRAQLYVYFPKGLIPFEVEAL